MTAKRPPVCGETEDWCYVQAHIGEAEFWALLESQLGLEKQGSGPLRQGYARWVPTVTWTDTYTGDYDRLAVMANGPGHGAFPITYWFY